MLRSLHAWLMPACARVGIDHDSEHSANDLQAAIRARSDYSSSQEEPSHAADVQLAVTSPVTASEAYAADGHGDELQATGLSITFS